jgi:hypothetical protein
MRQQLANSDIAKYLGVTRAQVYNYIQKYNIPPANRYKFIPQYEVTVTDTHVILHDGERSVPISRSREERARAGVEYQRQRRLARKSAQSID